MFSNINFSNHYKTAIFIIMAILMLVFIGKIADVAVMLFVAFIIAASVLPLINKFQKHMPRGLAVSLILLTVFMGILLIIIPLTMLAINQFAHFINQAPLHIEQFKNFINSNSYTSVLTQYINSAGLENIGQNLSTFAGDILSQGLTAGKVLASSITTILVVAVMVFYFCMDEEHIKKSYVSFFPPKFKDKASEILDILMSKVGGYMTAQLLTMASVGILTFIGLLIIHHPQAPLIGFLTFVLDIVPIIGPAIAIIIGLIASASLGIGYIALIFVIMLVAQWIESQLLRPYFFGKFMDMHPLLIIVSLLIGSKFLGIMGVILGPAFASLVCVLVNELYIKQINSSGK